MAEDYWYLYEGDKGSQSGHFTADNNSRACDYIDELIPLDKSQDIVEIHDNAALNNVVMWREPDGNWEWAIDYRYGDRP